MALILWLACTSSPAKSVADTVGDSAAGDTHLPNDSDSGSADSESGESGVFRGADTALLGVDAHFTPPLLGRGTHDVDHAYGAKLLGSPEESGCGRVSVLALQDASGPPSVMMGVCGISSALAFTAPLLGRVPAGAAAEWQGQDGSRATYSIQRSSDLDADGVADFVVGAMYREYSGHSTGGAYVVSGSLLGHEADLELQSMDVVANCTEDSRFSWQAGTDVTHLPDGGVGGPWVGVDVVSNSEYYFFDSFGFGSRCVDDAAATVQSAHSSLLGDVDGDGISDFVNLYPALGDLTSTYLLNGIDAGVWTEADGAAFWPLGEHYADPVDLNADGYHDVVLRYETDEGARAFAVFYGPFAGTYIANDAALSITAVGSEDIRDVSAGDINADGVPDLAFAGRLGSSSSEPGVVYLHVGPVTDGTAIADADYTFVGELEQFQNPLIDLGGDLDADGANDLLISSGSDDEGGEAAGAVWVIYASQWVP